MLTLYGRVCVLTDVGRKMLIYQSYGINHATTGTSSRKVSNIRISKVGPGILPTGGDPVSLFFLRCAHKTTSYHYYGLLGPVCLHNKWETN